MVLICLKKTKISIIKVTISYSDFFGGDRIHFWYLVKYNCSEFNQNEKRNKFIIIFQ